MSGILPSVQVQGLTELNANLANIQRTISTLFQQLAAIAVVPPGTATQAGNNTFTGANVFKLPPEIEAGAVGNGQFLPMGVLSDQLSIAGVGNGADTTDDTLFAYTLPANSLDATGRSLDVQAFGKFANNGHDKTVKLWFGSSLILTSNIIAAANVGWLVRMTVSKSGANTQLSIGFGAAGAAMFAVPLPVASAQTDTAAIVIKVTGSSPTTGAASDVVGQGMRVVFLN